MPKYDPPYMKRPIVKKPPQQHIQPMGISKTEETSLQGVDMGSRIITFGNLPSYSPGRPPLSPSLARSRSLDSCREHKLNPMKRSGPPGVGSQSEEEALQSVTDSELRCFVVLTRGRGGADNGGVGFVYGRYRQPPSSGTSGASGATGSQRGSDRLGCDYSDGQDSHAYTEEDDLERHDAGETADSESDEFVVLPKGIRGHAGQYFWPVGK